MSVVFDMATIAQAAAAQTYRTVGEALRAAIAFLEQAGTPDAATDARRLVAHALGISREALLRDPNLEPDEAALTRLAVILARRAHHEPVARIIGRRDFYGLSLSLGPETLDPRPDTETVVNIARHLAERIKRDLDAPLRILDLGTGTGAIALALLSVLPNAQAVASDISAPALDVARANADRHGLGSRIRFIKSQWLEHVDGRFDLIVANPPYIPTGEIAGLAPEVSQWDPRLALDGGDDGLDAYRAILRNISTSMAPGGWAIFEVGAGQAGDVSELARAHGLPTAPSSWPLLRDLGGIVRCVVAATPGCDVKKTLGIEDRSV